MLAPCHRRFSLVFATLVCAAAVLTNGSAYAQSGPACPVSCQNPGGPPFIPESEPCGVNTVNCGCDCAAQNFLQLRCPEGYCGELWAFQNQYDTDWYNVHVIDNGGGVSQVCFEVHADFPVVVQLFTGNCGGLTLVTQGEADDCHPLTLCACLPAPQFAKLKIYPGTIAGGPTMRGLPCPPNRRYTLRYHCAGTCDTGACCWLDATGVTQCGQMSQLQCSLISGGTYLGNNVPCPPAGTPCAPTGACCYQVPGTPAQCVQNTQSQCAQLPNSTWYPNTTCANIPAPSPCAAAPVGACCYIDANGVTQCVQTDQQTCLSQYNGTFLGNNTPCPAPGTPCDPPATGACCYQNTTGWNCVQTTQTDCVNVYNGTYYGDGTPCSPQLCEPRGACCYVDSTGVMQCAIVFQATCVNVLNGVYQGDNTLCTPNPCPPPPQLGACCFQDSPTAPWSCVQVTQQQCSNLPSGTWFGVGSLCANVQCTPPPTGACCHIDATGVIQCSITTLQQCQAIGGQWQGASTTCSPNPCVRGACCYQIPGAVGWFCTITTQADCVTNLNGVFQGVNTTCQPNPCPPPPTGACCHQTPTGVQCSVVTQPECSSLGGTYLGDNVSCTPNPCVTGACCTPQAGCQVVSPAQCHAMNGIYLGNNVPCTPTSCLPSCVRPPSNMVLWTPFDEAPPPNAIAHEIAAGNHGSHVGGLAVVSGAVNNALAFNGSSGFVNVPNMSQLNLGTGHLSIDAWIRTTASGGIQPIVDKRTGTIPFVTGYTLFLGSGQLAFQLADGAGFTNHSSGVFVANGQWRHVAVTVNRASPVGGRFYVDGVHVATFNPTGRPGNLNNAAPVWIGRRHNIPSSLWFNGAIDEVEIFRRALSAGEVQSIYNAGHGGKCKLRCHAKWNHPFCKNQNVVTVPITVCNDTAQASAFQLSFTGLPAGPGCSIAGPTSFSVVGPNPVNVPAFTCVTVNVQIQRPVGMNAVFQVGCYDVMIQNLTNGHTSTCRGSVIDRRDLCSVIIWPPMDIIDIALGTSQTLNFELRNTTKSALTVPIKIVAQKPPLKLISADVSLNGLPPGEPVITVYTIPPEPLLPVTVPVEVRFAHHEGLDFTDIALYSDVDGDGEFEPLASVAVRSRSLAHCAADIAPAGGDGIVNVNDLLAVINSWGACPPECMPWGGCPGDISPPGGDCTVNVNDLLAVINAWGPCP